MNFFESQDRAKRKTGRLILLFGLAVVSLIAVTNLLVIALFRLIPVDSVSLNNVSITNPASGYDWRFFVLVSFAVLAVIVLGSLYKLAALSGGGARIAEMLNGRLLLPDTVSFNERQLLNIVEEMALASGTPVPPVYLLDESGINAFAAGYSPGDAVIGITRGAIETLNRDELQGVIAHEFSHILHGDMRINIRLIAVLHGILVLSLIGYHLMRGGTYSRRSKGGSGAVLLGLGLLVLGYVGTFFGNLIKAAVSRQREYLADASAVQFTRNPHGIAGALMRIAMHPQRSYLRNASSVEISHALFEERALSPLRSLYATHPSIEARIGAILPDWDGVFDLERVAEEEKVDAQNSVTDNRVGREPGVATLASLAGLALADSIVEQIGQPGVQQLAEARHLLKVIPDSLLEAAHSPSSARALVYMMLIDGDQKIRQSQLEFLERSADLGITAELHELLRNNKEVPAYYRLPLLSISLHSLRQLSFRQYNLFSTNLAALIKIDDRVSLFEWALLKIVTSTLDPIFKKRGPRPLGRKDINDCLPELESLLSLLAYSDRESEAEPEQAFERARERLGNVQIKLRARKVLNFSVLDGALDKLTELKPLQKPALLKACVACIMADEKAAAIEVELLRAIGVSLDCPIPPLSVR
ncbi:MAG: M48 family metallopeptidase [Gammaproteobacteria bacterium]|jgi:Zn-dependent protease with chaperone function